MSVEGLQNRQLMAADFGMDDFIIMGPQPAAYVSTPTPVANVVATAETDDPNVFWYETNGLTPNVFKDGSKIRINGTLLRDEIEFTQTGDRVEILAKTYNNSGRVDGGCPRYVPSRYLWQESMRICLVATTYSMPAA